MANPIKPCVDNKISKNGRSNVVLENVEEKDNGDKTEVRAETIVMKLNGSFGKT